MAEDEVIENNLRRALTLDDPPSIAGICRELGLPTIKYYHYIRHNFPELHSALTRKRERRRREIKRDIKAKLKNILRLKTPISLNKTYKLLGYVTATVIREVEPGLCKKIVARYAEYRKSHSHLKKDLLPILKEIPPPPLIEVSKRLKIRLGTLREKFPKLCSQIVIRFKAFRSNASMIRKQKLRQDIQRVVLELKSRGLVPSHKRIVKCLRVGINVRYAELAQMIYENQTTKGASINM
jgi:hypothetical protein